MRSDPVTIHLASDVVVLRSGLAGEDGEPARLTGEVRLDLPTQCSIKDITFIFSGRAHTSFTEATPPFKSHHLDEIIFNQDFSMLASINASGSTSSGAHSHTLNAGEHTFPFTLDLPPELPATLFTASSNITYRIKVIVVRPGFTERNWSARRAVRVHHGLRGDAIEYQTSLDIENDWPGKVSYAITIPYKAHAAGAEIPCHVKFVPHIKGVRVMTLITTVRMHTTLYSKNHQTSMSRDVLTVKHDLSGAPGDASPGVAPVEYVAPEATSNGTGSAGFSSPPVLGSSDPAAPILASELRQRLASVSLEGRERPSVPRLGPGEAEGPGSAVAEPEDEDDGRSSDVHTIIRVRMPNNATPSHARAPIVISHRIKWSALIRNPDGHTSELRCALPIHILAQDLAEEARLASAGASNLLFGPSGVLLPTTQEEANVQLPSYRDHVHDRVASAHTPSHFTTEYVPASWSASARSSPLHTPTHTPGHSRPGSPTFGQSSSGGNSGSRTPAAGASSASLSAMRDEAHPVNWADSELVSSVTGRSPSTAEVHADHMRRVTSRSDALAAAERPDPPSRQASTSSIASHGNRFHLHIPKPLRSFTSLHNHGASPSAAHPPVSNPMPSSSSLAVAAAAAIEPTSPDDDGIMMATPRRRLAPLEASTALPPASSTAMDRGVSHEGDEGLDVLRQVPSYDAATNWLGGGVVPLDSMRDLPDYESSSAPVSRRNSISEGG